MNNWNEYPRPSLKRENRHRIINDGWTLNGSPINLPYPPESELSEYQGEITEELIYEKLLPIPEEAVKTVQKGGHILLHFGAADQIAEVYADDELIVKHTGGYTPFTADLTDVVLTANPSKNIEASLTGETGDTDISIPIKVRVTDTLDHTYPYGKQRRDRGGMWYTPISGIWQTVWLEWVPHDYIQAIRITPGDETIEITLDVTNPSLVEYSKITIGKYSFTPTGTTTTIKLEELGGIENLRFWSPDDPYLYDISVEYGDDRITSYFALRTVSIEEIKGCKRICVNKTPVFLNGVLDQGYHQKGIFLPDSPDEYERDILRMKELGFNMLRKHIKVEPELFYYACDRLGMYVMQDMVNNGEYKFFVDTALATFGLRIKDKGRYKNFEQRANFVSCAEETQDFVCNHPSVIGYTIFNEGWGQTDSDMTGDYLRTRDNTRFYDYTSGWFEQAHSQVESVHVYFRTKNLKSHGKPLLLSEFGGFTREIEGHIFNPDKSYGYGKCKDEAELTDRIIATYEKMVIPAISRGLCGCVYTQLSDIEDEINGLYTYDREICKVDKAKLSAFFDINLKMG